MKPTMKRLCLGMMLGLLPAALGGCTAAGTAAGAGAAVGVAAYQERGVEGVARDLRIQAALFDKWLQHDHTLPARLGTEVYEGRVLLTGVLDDAQLRSDAVRLAWEVDGVRQVLNEIQLAGGGALNLARDSWISAQLESRLTFDGAVYAINYGIETVNGVIYLIGIAQDRRELDRVLAHARDIDYVRKVISHVRIKGDGDRT